LAAVVAALVGGDAELGVEPVEGLRGNAGSVALDPGWVRRTRCRRCLNLRLGRFGSSTASGALDEGDHLTYYWDAH
jgi:hypothetical protein